MSGPLGDKILVTGALGQIGTELVEALRKQHGSTSVIASDLRPTDQVDVSQGPYQTLDVLDTEAIIGVCKEQGVGTVYHLAALLSATGEMNPELCRKVNVGGTISVFEAAQTCSMRVFTPSSIAVYGPDAPKHAPQITPLNPTTVYGKTKVEGEQLAKEYDEKYGLDIRGIRYPGLISYKAPAGGGTTDYAVEIFDAALNDGHYDCFVRADTRLPMLYMDDAIRATLMLMDVPSEHLGESKAGYNIDCFSFTAEELAIAIANEVDGFTFDFKPDVRQNYADSWPDSIDGSVAKEEWNWLPQYDLDAMVKAMLDGLSKNQ
ncbi:MAG: putative epimerase/dehydratase [Candidatus Poseidoniaceae archaeon]|nr:MAG: putative epimerase/dehydratase [Candidatus Poseidoniaceae archaeon]